MSGFAFITGKKYMREIGKEIQVFYPGMVQENHYVYFNDETKYRCNVDGSNLQMFYYEKQIWVTTSLINDLHIYAFDVTGVLGAINDLINDAGGHGGGGTSADIPGLPQTQYQRLDAVCDWFKHKCSISMSDPTNGPKITYSWINRNIDNPGGMSYDCSSFVICGFNQIGHFNINASDTTTMRAGFLATGKFIWIPGNSFTETQLKPGDVLLNENALASGHTSVYAGNGKVYNCGPRNGVWLQNFTGDNWGRGWHGVLRYNGQ